MLGQGVEPLGTAVFLLVVGILIALSVLLSRRIDRLGVPIVLLFLVLGMLGGSEGIGGIAFEDYGFAFRVGTIYLVLILVDGGMNTPWHAVKQAALPAGLLATAGVVFTAGLLALFMKIFGLNWTEALLLGAVVSSTDAAAVFAVLRGGSLRLKPRVANILEVESCANDPMAVLLTLIMIGIAQSSDLPGWHLALTVPWQFAIGAGVGLLVGFLGMRAMHAVKLPTAGLYPALTLAVAFLAFGAATLIDGSGLLSVYVAALVMGNSPLPYRSGLTRVHESLGWLSQIALFLMLGLLVFPSRLVPIMGTGLVAALFLTFVARPIAVFLCLAPLRLSAKEIAYIGWIGLRGAVPIILGALPVLSQIPGAERVFNLVFFIVVVSAILPGTTIRAVTRWLKLAVPEKPSPSAVLEINSAHSLNGEIASFHIEPALAVCGASLSQLRLPPDSGVILIVRGNELVAARGHTVLLPGDHVYVFFQPCDRPYIELLFGKPERT